MIEYDIPHSEFAFVNVPIDTLRAELIRRQAEDAAPPACGSGSHRAHYNTSLHVAALFLILALSTLACSIPIVVRRFPQLPVPHRFLFLSRHFGTGVLIATAFVHLLPTAFVSLTDPCLPPFWNEGYPAMAGLIAMISVLVVVGVEMFFATKGAGHVHGADFVRDDEEESKLLEMRPVPGGSGFGKPRAGTGTSHFRQSSIGPVYPAGSELEHGGRGSSLEQLQQQNGFAEDRAYDRELRDADDDDDDDEEEGDSLDGLDDPATKPHQRTANRHGHGHTNGYANVPSSTTTTHPPRTTSTSNPYAAASTFPDPSDSAAAARLLLQCLLLEAGILFHSIFIGMALSVSTGPPFLVLLIAISFHQTFEGLALGSRIAAIPSFSSSSPRPWLMALAYGTTTPFGQAIGLLVHNLYDPESEAGLLLVGVMNSVSSGLLLFAGLVELLAEDFLREESYVSLRGRKRVEACGAVVAGALLMALVGAWA